MPGRGSRAVTFDGRTVELFNEPGQFGLKRMIEAATRKRKDGGVFELRWANGNVSVAVDLKIISSRTAGGDGDAASQGRGFHGMRLPARSSAAPMDRYRAAVAAAAGGSARNDARRRPGPDRLLRQDPGAQRLHQGGA